ncbi:MAG: hypothetical protein M5U34_08510 [Chloroflexi bacterium]|nr:hypothetical protein [Chloroflexota bacterium]
MIVVSGGVGELQRFGNGARRHIHFCAKAGFFIDKLQMPPLTGFINELWLTVTAVVAVISSVKLVAVNGRVLTGMRIHMLHKRPHRLGAIT